MPDINRAFSWLVETCNAPRVGYSQAYRNQQTVGGITYYDCSSIINYSLLNGGFETPLYAPSHNAFTTVSMGAELIRLGFQEVPANGELLPGDIGINPGHTEMCYEGGTGRGIFMGAHTDNAPLADQVSIAFGVSASWQTVYRYGEGGAGGYGSSIYVIAALAGNAWRESHINPTLNQQNGSAFGIFQWDGDRKTELLAWLAENGYEDTSPIGQMQYLIVENDWMGSFGGIDSLEAFMKSTSTDIPMLTEAFCTCWERPGVPALEERIRFAEDAYLYINAHANDTSIKEWETEPMYYLSWEQALNNAVLMYRYYSAGGGGGGTPGTKKKHMPLWMMQRRKNYYVKWRW